MLQEELEYLRKLQKGKPVDSGRYAGGSVGAERCDTVLSRLIRQQAELSVCWRRVCDRCGAVSIGL